MTEPLAQTIIETSGVARIGLRIADGRICGVELSPPATPDLGVMLRGREGATVPALVRLIFPICGAAHEIACARAIAAAQGAEASDRPGDAAALAAEMALSHAMRATLYWPPAVGDAPEPTAMAGVVKAAAAYRAAPGPETARALAAALRFAVFGESDFDAGDLRALAAWAQVADAPGARISRAVAKLRLREPVTAKLAQAPAAWFGARLAGNAEFAAQPDVDGIPGETGAFARLDPGDVQTASAHGPAAARLLAMQLASARLARDLESGAPLCTQPDTFAPEIGEGCTVVETARGPLAYWVRLDAAGRIADIRALAPIAFALHPAGPLAQMLDGMPAEAAERATRLAAAAVDPCANVAITLREAADA